MMKLTVHHSIDEFSKESWNTLARHYSVYYSFEWCKAFEKEFSSRPLYVAAYEGNKLVAVLPAFIIDDPHIHDYFNPRDLIFCEEFLSAARATYDKHPNEYEDNITWFDKKYGLRPERLDQYFFPCLSVVSPCSYHGDVLISDNANWGSVVKELFAKLGELGKQHNVKCICCHFIPETNHDYTRFLKQDGFVPAFAKPAFELDIKFGSFEEYISSLSAKRRNMVRKEIKKCSDAGIIIKMASGDEIARCRDRIIGLLHSLLSKHGHNMSPQQIEERIVRIYESFGDGVETYFAFKANRPVGALLSFVKDLVHYPKYIGLDEVELDGTYAYFSLAYYELIKNCINAGIKKIDYGYASERAKMVRGCSCHDVYCYYKFTDKTFESDLKMFLNKYNPARKRYYDDICAL